LFNEYLYPLFNISPVLLITGQADLDKPEMAHREGYNLWDIDLEFTVSPQFLM